MNFYTLLEATIKLGVPMTVLSWIIFAWLYGGGDLDENRTENLSLAKSKR